MSGSREVRRVPKDWEHPKHRDGRLIPLHKELPFTEAEIKDGLKNGWLKGKAPNYDCDVMPKWKESERSHYQMYETTSEGTPISPVMETPEQLAKWLADNKKCAFADIETSYDQWMSIIKKDSWSGLITKI